MIAPGEVSDLIKAGAGVGAVLGALGAVITGWLRKPKAGAAEGDHVVLAADLADSKPIRELASAVGDLTRQTERARERASDDAEDLRHQIERLIDENRRSANALEDIRRQSARPPVA